MMAFNALLLYFKDNSFLVIIDDATALIFFLSLYLHFANGSKSNKEKFSMLKSFLFCKEIIY